MVIRVTDIHHDPREVALHRDILISYLKKISINNPVGIFLTSNPSQMHETLQELQGGRRMGREPYHDREDVLVNGFVIQCLRSVERAGRRIQTKLLETQRIDATLQGVDEFVFLILIHSTDLQNLCFWRCVLRNNDFILGCRELRTMVICVYDFDEYL